MNKSIIGVLICLSLFSACKDESASNKETSKQVSEEVESDTIQDQKELSQKVEDKNPIDFVKMVAEQISEREFSNWDEFSKEQVFFSPYAQIDTSSLVYLSSDDLSEYYDQEKKWYWGVQDGTGDRIELSFKKYLDRYVNDFDFFADAVEYSIVDQPKVYGNELHNVTSLYPESTFVEVHKPSTDEMGMNWRSLIFVLEKIDGDLRLHGVVHNEWTI